jgi:hypothetical protein
VDLTDPMDLPDLVDPTDPGFSYPMPIS